MANYALTDWSDVRITVPPAGFTVEVWPGVVSCPRCGHVMRFEPAVRENGRTFAIGCCHSSNCENRDVNVKLYAQLVEVERVP